MTYWSRTTLNISLFLLVLIAGYGLADCPPADRNGDCFVDFEDLAILASQWLSPSADGNGDYLVNLEDLAILANQWFTGTPVISDDYHDMLTPGYYSVEGSPSSGEVNTFLYYARKERFHHPLENDSGQIPQFYVSAYGVFGAGKGPTGTSQHHPAVDIYIAQSENNTMIYAAHNGYTATYRDALKYRHYLSITKDIEDHNGQIIGRMVTLYAHIDLDLDEQDNIHLDGQYVNKGDLVSKNLYSGTMGGPHLHFEIRYYRPGELGTESFYGFVGPLGSTILTEPSAGDWSYGYWDPYTGYGFAEPKNHGIFLY
ncbi:MAG: peptidoglycan DD-metalloendopeptidase family protein [Anaerohalosphaera sp.]|nr:peptidoglycan DD-metalloendopeptidase family protein [Anaerohalosphaera sp.]